MSADLQQQILFTISALGGINGIFLTGYFLFKAKSTLTDKFLAALLLMISVRILKSVVFFFNPDIPQIFLQIGLSACMMIGPFTYFYSLAATKQLSHTIFPWPVHLSLLTSLLVIGGSIFPYSQYPELWGANLFKIIYYSWIVYIILSVHVWYKSGTIKPLQNMMNLDKNVQFQVSIILCSFIIWLAYFTSRYTSYIFGAVCFSFVSYLLIYLFIKSKSSPAKAPYQDKKIPSDEAAHTIQALQNLMKEKQLYTNPDITLADVAHHLTIKPHKLSQLLNDNLNQSFLTFINSQRIDLAKSYLKAEKHMKMDDLAYACGFNAQSTFYAAFKKSTGTTPAQYRKNKG